VLRHFCSVAAKTRATRNPQSISPNSWNLDYAEISRQGQHWVQLDLFMIT
jgi:hypothetical protein